MTSPNRPPFALALGFFLLFLLLSGCSGSIYVRPQVDIPQKWSNAISSNDLTHTAPWWESFGDDQLNTLIIEVLARNSDIATAAINVQQAQVRLNAAGDPLRIGPQGNLEKNNYFRGAETVRANSNSLYGNSSYMIDLWGNLAHQRDIAGWALQASEADKEAISLNIIGVTASTYWQIGFLNQRIFASGKSLQIAIRTQQLVEAQFIAGAVSNLERREAEQAVLTQKSRLSQLKQNREEALNILAVLFNTAPEKNVLKDILNIEPQSLPITNLPTITEGVPSELLGRRPDLRAAELSLRQSLTSIDVVRTSFYPSLSLTGSLGAASTSLSTLLANPVAIIGIGANLPFFNIKSAQTNTDLARLQHDAAVIRFRKTLYQAFLEVENALSARMRLAEQEEFQAQNLKAAREAERLYEIRYRAGAVALRIYLDAQEAHRAAELLWAQTRLNQLHNFVSLYQSLGGDIYVR